MMKFSTLTLALLAAGLASQSITAFAAANGGGGGVVQIPITAQPRAVIKNLGSLGGSAGSQVNGMNDNGEVVGMSFTKNNTSQHAFLYSNAVMTDISQVNTQFGYASAINNSGQIVGSDNNQGFLYSNGQRQPLGGEFNSGLNFKAFYPAVPGGINNIGQITASVFSPQLQKTHANFNGLDIGNGNAANTTDDSFGVAANDNGLVLVRSKGKTVVYDSKTGNSPVVFYYQNNFFNINTNGNAINNNGQVVGNLPFFNNTSHAFIFDSKNANNINALTDLGTLGGSSSDALGINDTGQVVGTSTTTGNTGSHATLWTGYGIVDLDTLAPSFWTYTSAVAINRFGQIAGNGIHSGHSEGFLLTLHPDWQGGNGAWEDGQHWNFGTLGVFKGMTPGSIHDVIINPHATATVLGSANADVRSLVIGGVQSVDLALDLKNGGHTPHIITLNLNHGNTATSHGTTILSEGILAGSGLLQGDLKIEKGGEVHVATGESMLFHGGAFNNAGVVNVIGVRTDTTTLTVAGGVKTGLAENSGVINVEYGHLNFLGGLANGGQLNFNKGNNDFKGNLTILNGAKTSLAGNGHTVFHDDVEIQTGGELNVSAGSSASFLGTVQQRTGALMTGKGDTVYQGGFSIGASPGFGSNEGNVTFGQNSLYLAEIGGNTGCTLLCATDVTFKNSSFDRYDVGGKLTFGGTLKILSWLNFTGQLGDSFDLFDWGSTTGQFSSIDYTGLNLAAGSELDLSRLYVDGVITVVAVPEPGTYALMLAGLGLIGMAKRRQTKKASTSMV